MEKTSAGTRASMTVLGLQAVGGWSGLEARVPADFFSMWKPMNHPNFPWTGIVFGAPILGVWYWCTDQHIVQRVGAAGERKPPPPPPHPPSAFVDLSAVVLVVSLVLT